MELRETNESVLFARGDEAAFERIVHEYTHPVYRFVFRLVGNREAAEDLTQDTFVKLWKTARQYDPARSLRAWIFTIARNTVYDFLRTKRHVQMRDLILEGEESVDALCIDDAPLPDARFAAREVEEMVHGALQKLSYAARSVVMLHIHEGLTFDEIALVVDAPMNTVKSQYRRALLSLKRELEVTMHQNEGDTRI